MSKCHKDTIGSRGEKKGQEDETRDREVAARTDEEETHKGLKKLSSNKIDQVTGVLRKEGEERH